jgi:hypothetical protein
MSASVRITNQGANPDFERTDLSDTRSLAVFMNSEAVKKSG